MSNIDIYNNYNEDDYLVSYIDEDNYHSINNLLLSNELTFENRWYKRIMTWFKEKFVCIPNDNYSVNSRLKNIHKILNITDTYQGNNYSFPLLNNFLFQTQKKNKRTRSAPLSIVFSIKYSNKFIMIETSIPNDWRIINLDYLNQPQISKYRKEYTNKTDLIWKSLYLYNPNNSKQSIKNNMIIIINELTKKIQDN